MTDEEASSHVLSDLRRCSEEERYQLFLWIMDKWPREIVRILEGRGWTVSKKNYKWEIPQ